MVVDEAHLRDVRATMAQFATGVAVVTTAHAGEPCGMTVSAFCSVSLDPPMALVSLARSSRTLARIRVSGVYVVNILADEQRSLAERFAGKDPHGKTFADIPWHPGVTGAPLFDDALARIECRVAADYPGGDHALLLGRVVAIERRDPTGVGHPLLYYRAALYGQTPARSAESPA